MGEKAIDGKLVISMENQELIQYPLQGSLVIGSDKEQADYVLEEKYVSAVHGRLFKGEAGYVYQDLRKETRRNTYENRTLLNGKALEEFSEDQQEFLLKDGDSLRFLAKNGEMVVLIFRRSFQKNVSWHSVNMAEAKEKIYISRQDGTGSVYQEHVTELPKHYASLYMQQNQWKVQDNSTVHGIYRNGEKVTEEQTLSEGDVLRIGNTLFLYRKEKLFFNHRESSSNQLVIHIEERSVWNFFRKKILLEDIDLTIDPGEMVLILGGSGAGKTTFINAVMGYEKAKGVIMEGDRDLYKDYNNLKYEIGFVPQQDLLRDEDTVFDTLDNAAELRMPAKTTEEERKKRIEEVLTLFGLEREEESLVEKLSGGQKKRLSIAVEYISNPTLFFLDEPDSGLDGVMARSLMENLRKIADDEKIVLVITHAPDRVSDLFDKVVVLAKGEKDNVGHLAFYGMIEEAKSFFGVSSMEQIVKKINRTDEGGEGMADEFIAKFKEMEEA